MVAAGPAGRGTAIALFTCGAHGIGVMTPIVTGYLAHAANEEPERPVPLQDAI